MYDKPLVTVITATYNLIQGNRVEHFRQCVESVHNQTYAHIEYLFIDGASTDGTLELLREYEDKGWARVISEPDKGIYDAFNKGIAHARGKYIAFLNSDDLWHDPRGVEASVHLLELSGADFSYASVSAIDEEGRLTELKAPRIGLFFLETPFCHQTMFTRTELLRDMGGFDVESYRLLGDQDVITRLIMRGSRAVRVPLNFVSFRSGGISTQAAFREQFTKERREIIRRLYEPILSPEELEKLYTYTYTPELMDTAMQMAQPCIAADLQLRCKPAYKQPGYYRYHYNDVPCRYLPPAAAPAPQAAASAPQEGISPGEWAVGALLADYGRLRRRYLLCKLKALLSWGKRRQRYQERQHQLQRVLRLIREARRKAMDICKTL